jgi:hypothetical protein
MNKTKIPDEIGIPVTWYEDEESGDIIFDIGLMQEYFTQALEDLEEKYGG